MPQKHFSNDILLAHLDGELAADETRTVQKHLAHCWLCRAQQAELESRVHHIAAWLDSCRFPQDSQVEEAKRRFVAWRDEFDQSEPLQTAFLFRPPAFSWPLAVCLAAFAILFGGAALWLQTAPSATAVLARAKASDARLCSPTALVHEVFQSELSEISQRSRSLGGHLDLWSQQGSNRYAWRWNDASNHLRYAEWHPAKQESYVLTPQLTAAVFRPPVVAHASSSLAEVLAGSATFEQMNAAFIAWVGSQPWHVVSLAGDFAAFSNEQGIKLSARREKGPANDCILIEASQIIGARRLSLTLEVDERTGEALSETANIVQAQRSVTLRLVRREIRTLQFTNASLGVFRPDIAIVASRPSRPFVKSVPPQFVTRSVDDRTLQATEIELLYILHRAGLCVGSPIAINVDHHSQVVRLVGRIETAVVRDEIKAAIGKLAHAKHVEIELKTTSEVAAEVHQPAWHATPPVIESKSQHWSALPIEDLISRSSLSESEKSRLKIQLATSANEIVSTTEELRRDSWALNQLGARLTLTSLPTLDDGSRQLALLMVHDHLTTLEQNLTRLTVLAAPFRSLTLDIADFRNSATSHTLQDPAGWQPIFALLLQAAEEINLQSQALFALSPDSPSSPAVSARNMANAVTSFGHLLGEANHDLNEMASQFRRTSYPPEEIHR